MRSEPTTRQHILALVAMQVIALAAIVLVTLPIVFKRHQLDLAIYFQYAQKLMSGMLPYRDFTMEYPPLALLPFTLPMLAALGRSLGFGEYIRLFLLQSVVLSTLIALVIAGVLGAWRPWRAVTPALALYVLLVAIVAPLMPWRYDLFPALLTVLALLCVMRDRPGWAGIWLGCGVAAKLYPIVLLPIFGAYYLGGNDRRALARMALGGAGALGLALMPFVLTAPGDLLVFLRYHAMRGLQVESLPAGAIILAHVLGLAAVRLDFNYGALHLASPLAGPTLRWLPFAFVIVFGILLAVALARFREEQRVNGAVGHASLTAFAMAALLTFIATNKVFSPQYLVWLLPFAPLLRRRQAILFAVICALTIVLFPFDYDDLLAMQLLPVLLLNLRNLLVVALLLWLLAAYLPESARAALSIRPRSRAIPEAAE
jgi:hypothetical protein